MEDTPLVGPDTRPFRPKQLTTDDIRAGCIKLYGNDDTETEVCVINEEMRQGLDVAEKYNHTITIFGSARTTAGETYYEKARRVAFRAAQAGYAVITGGGPGIMEAGNRGAHEAQGISVGMTIQLPHEQVSNPYITEEVPFYFFFTRKTAMRYGSEVYLFFPGGFGTLDELMETLTLVQTKKISPAPVILVGEAFWRPLHEFIMSTLVTEKLVDQDDPHLYTITDDEDAILNIITNAPLRDKN